MQSMKVIEDTLPRSRSGYFARIQPIPGTCRPEWNGAIRSNSPALRAPGTRLTHGFAGAGADVTEQPSTGSPAAMCDLTGGPADSGRAPVADIGAATIVEMNQDFPRRPETHQ